MTRRLHLQFEQADEFQREFERNIAKGGVFVPGASDLELREVVDVEIALPFCARSVRLEAEVVHVVGAELAPSRAAVGAAVQFLRPASEVRAELAGAVERPASSPAATPPADLWQLEDFGDGEGSTLDELEVGDLETGLEIGETGGLLGGPDPDEEIAAPGSSAIEDDRGKDAFGLAHDLGETAGKPAPPAWEERRKSPRSPARVPASLHGPNARIEGLTRDLSETGALISADASEFPIGKDVRLSLQHPMTGGRLEVGGRVVRHVETEGTVAAVSVLFDVPSERKDELAALVRAAQNAHRERGASGISGQIEEVGMPSLIQMLGRSSPVGMLAVRSGAEEGVLAFEAGSLRYARLGVTRGLKALARMLLWQRGSFEFHAHVAPLDHEDEPIRLEAALLEVTRLADEAARGRGARFQAVQRFRVDREALASTEALDKTAEAVLDLAAAGFTVRRILDVIPESDAQISGALLELVGRGVLVPAD